MDYELTRLGPREFQHLVQALALQLGPAIRILGDGPDGGRDAEFHGRVNAPSGALGEPEWSGFGVVQAKFLQRPLGAPHDGDWLLAQMRRELTSWTKAKSRRAAKAGRPEFYLLATNVVLSPAIGGGLDKVDQLFAKYAPTLGLKGWAVWHYDQICILLDDAVDVRRTYAALITPGDVLAQIMHVLGDGPAGMLGDRLAAHAAKELLSEQWVRLGKAGSKTAEKLSLCDIAIDLKGTRTRPEAPQKGESIVERFDVARRIIAMDQPDGATSKKSRLVPTASSGGLRRVLIIGGPGQGKTTLGQLICQAYRVALLGEGRGLGDDAERAIPLWLDRLSQLDLPIPTTRRWPIRIDLATYADAIAGGEDISLIRFLADTVSKRSPTPVTSRELLAWLHAWPWLLVLDGLDEVASPSIRENLLRQLTDFGVDVSTENGDVVLIVTTRPQGYAGELGEVSDYATLEPLTPEEAIGYAEKLAALRHAGDVDFRDQVTSRVRVAAREEVTARLMRSPLQVTIMSLLLERMQRAPQSRYALFKAYYDTIYAREVEKGGSISKLLEEQRSHIDDLHEQVALRLQIDAETRGEAEVQLHSDKLRELIAGRLRAEGHRDSDVAVLTDRIVVAAMHRLVLLTPQALDHVGFEIRTLQEYLAARAVTTGPEPEIIDRLKVLLPSAHWRNTWLFAVGRLFVEREHLRSTLVGMLAEADNASLLTLQALPGADAAFDLLDDDVAANSPEYRRQLVERAAKALSVGSVRSPEVTANVLGNAAAKDPVARSLILMAAEAALADSVGSPYTLLVLAAWKQSRGPFGDRARRLTAAHGSWETADILRLYEFVITGSERAAARHLRVAPTETVGSMVREVINLAKLGTVTRRRLKGLLSELDQCSLTVVDGTATRGIAHIRLPRAEALVEALRDPDAAEVLAGLPAALGDAQWPVGAYVRRIIQYGFTRDVVGAELTRLLEKAPRSP